MTGGKGGGREGGGRGWAHLEVSEREEELREPRQLEEEDVAGTEQLRGAVV